MNHSRFCQWAIDFYLSLWRYALRKCVNQTSTGDIPFNENNMWLHSYHIRTVVVGFTTQEEGGKLVETLYLYTY